ncbi:hypothetical protein GCM10008935_10000 [Alkalibacillus silvisoli]|uniref:Uncharacterized protein n=1 Tax=Alkalibacillus silvisoli TaxID=392823 RepID=A0ABN0ZRV3_9BACI
MPAESVHRKRFTITTTDFNRALRKDGKLVQPVIKFELNRESN